MVKAVAELGEVVDIREHQAAIQKVSKAMVKAVAGLASKLQGFLNKNKPPPFYANTTLISENITGLNPR